MDPELLIILLALTPTHTYIHSIVEKIETNIGYMKLWIEDVNLAVTYDTILRIVIIRLRKKVSPKWLVHACVLNKSSQRETINVYKCLGFNEHGN